MKFLADEFIPYREKRKLDLSKYKRCLTMKYENINTNTLKTNIARIANAVTITLYSKVTM